MGARAAWPCAGDLRHGFHDAARLGPYRVDVGEGEGGDDRCCAGQGARHNVDATPLVQPKVQGHETRRRFHDQRADEARHQRRIRGGRSFGGALRRDSERRAHRAPR